MYNEFIKNFETKWGVTWPEENKDIGEKEAFNKPYIQEIYKGRINLLEQVVEHFIVSCRQKIKLVPWGVRWICKELAVLSKEYFPDADPYKRGSIVGGFIFLRLLNPIIVAPHIYGVIEGRASKIQYSTLKTTSKVLQKLSNGTQFSETHMKEMNKFLQKRKIQCNVFYNELFKLKD
eukprot:UN24833